MLQAGSVQAGPPSGVDVLRWPVIGRFLHWRHARRSVQIVLLAAAAAIRTSGFPEAGKLAAENVLTVPSAEEATEQFERLAG